MPDGSKMPGADAYATSKQCLLAAAMAFSRETPRLRFNAIEPGFTPNTGLSRDANTFLRFLANYLLPLLAPYLKYWSTPKRAARLEAEVLTDTSGQTGIYYDEKGHPMLGSMLSRDKKFQDRVVAETRAFLSKI
jgi:NAD(P)-dependent dehydrogenase (short-subunit alcohol dehydrogenase family)